jgi:predicted ATP-dependent serine protease
MSPKTNKIKKLKLYKCPECGLEYLEKKWQDKCQAWCAKHKSCNLEIIERAVKKDSFTTK